SIVAVVARSGLAGWRDLAVTAVVVATLAWSSAQIGNFMSGGTPGILRYGVWLIPLTVPMLQRRVLDARWTRGGALLAIPGAALSLVRDRPSIDEFAGRPSAVALVVWQHAPSASRPLPIVFAGSLGSRTLPVATADCGKILLVGRGDAQAMWPRTCAPVT